MERGRGRDREGIEGGKDKEIDRGKDRADWRSGLPIGEYPRES
jgi:hypothetical protein